MHVIICDQHHVENWLKVASYYFEGENTLIVLDDCAASKDVKGRTGELVKLGFSVRHAGISVWVLTQQLFSIAKPFRENVAAIVLFYTPSAKTTKAIGWVAKKVAKENLTPDPSSNVMNYAKFTAVMAGSIALKRYLEDQKILPDSV